MASVQKFTAAAVPNQLRHLYREIRHNSNQDIDPTRSNENYSLTPPREGSAYDFYLQRKSELYCYGRTDVKTIAAWIVTAPRDLPPGEEAAFFQASYRFLASRYGEENTVAAVVHRDEAGQPHLHFCFIPVVADPRHGGEKICANQVLTPRELRSFHPDLQRYITSCGIHATVQSGITAAQGGSRSVWDLKQGRSHEYERGRW